MKSDVGRLNNLPHFSILSFWTIPILQPICNHKFSTDHFAAYTAVVVGFPKVISGKSTSQFVKTHDNL